MEFEGGQGFPTNSHRQQLTPVYRYHIAPSIKNVKDKTHFAAAYSDSSGETYDTIRNKEFNAD